MNKLKIEFSAEEIERFQKFGFRNVYFGPQNAAADFFSFYVSMSIKEEFDSSVNKSDEDLWCVNDWFAHILYEKQLSNSERAQIRDLAKLLRLSIDESPFVNADCLKADYKDGEATIFFLKSFEKERLQELIELEADLDVKKSYKKEMKLIEEEKLHRREDADSMLKMILSTECPID